MSIFGRDRMNSTMMRVALPVAVAVASLWGASIASGEGLEISSFGGSTTINGQLTRQAGGHPDLTTDLRIGTATGAEGEVVPSGDLKRVVVDLPPGIAGNPTAIPTCSAAELIKYAAGGQNGCPIGAQVGVARIITGGQPQLTAIYNMERPPDLPALFAFNYSGAVVPFQPRVRAGDFGISVTVPAASQALELGGSTVTFWGVPADPIHNAERFDPHKLGPGRGGFGTTTTEPLRAFMTAPTTCAGTALETRIAANSWQRPDLFAHASFDADFDGTPFVLEGCERLPFDPSVTVRPGSQVADAPSGLTVDLTVPQTDSAYGVATSHLRTVKMTLPEGVTVSPSSAAGLGACSLSQIGLDTTEAPSCPNSSKLGKVEIETPLLDETLRGDVILAKQNDNPFNSLLALYLAIKGPGFYLKLPGKIEADPVTGQLTTVFDDNPQLPFEHLRLELNGGPRAALTMPRRCGAYTVKTDFIPWSGTGTVSRESTFAIDQGCDTGGFSPQLNAGTVDPTAGSFSPFLLQVTRASGEANLAKLTATLPEGLLAKLKGVPLCGDAQAVTGDCPAGSQVGAVTVGAGSGSAPLYVPEPGKAATAAYLGGPYRGAPYSLVVKVPAQAGPFDLGTVTVRNALRIDTTTAQVTAVSDPLPQILQGIPIAYRDLRVEVNRPDFTVNPTSCKQMAVTSILTSAPGQTATPSSPFQASGCSDLGFKPSLKISLKGKMNRTGNPALTATLKAPKGEANIAKTTVVLPQSQFIDNSHISNPCTMPQFNSGNCPAGSILGRATAYTPLLDKPLTGPVYFRSNGGARELPDLVADLKGQIHVTLVGFIDSVPVRGTEATRVRTRFQNVPDAPVSKFVLKLSGGKKGLIENSEDLCSFTPKAKVQMTGQNGKTANSNLKLGTSCGKARRKR